MAQPGTQLREMLNEGGLYDDVTAFLDKHAK